ncbi:TIGR01906 family membrane protein [Pseudarthrobacter sp. J1763]|uniref:TIGR01906 family membrane protein n=1 Tax=Pseudarthrobacter sp. J1763 TaxID=3420445 RepID=UPI003D2BD49C
MSENKPKQEPIHLDSSQDTDEPAFDWLKTPARKEPSTEAEPATQKLDADSVDSAEPDNARPDNVGPDKSGAGHRATSASESKADAIAAADSETAASASSGAKFEDTEFSRADAAAINATRSTSAGETEPTGTTPLFEPHPTSALQVRPPEDEIQRRKSRRDQVANSRPVAPRIIQVLLAVFFPVIVLAAAVRAVASPLFLWVEYHRPGFPGDGYGFSTDDRLSYGSYAMDYLSNFAAPRYLGDLVNASGEKLFKSGEVSHMADVKNVMLSTWAGGTLLVILAIIAIIYLRKRSTGGVRRALFAGSIVTLVIIITLGVLGVLGWERFFTDFHHIFFANGTWTFSLDDTLIRLFPAQFWMDAGIAIAGLVLLVSIVTLILTWPTRKRRGLSKSRAKA